MVKLTIENMKSIDKVDEIMLETEVINQGALNLYESFGFLRTKRLYRYYLNTHDAYIDFTIRGEITNKNCLFATA